MENKVSWFKKKKVTASFGVVALIAGFIFLDSGVTGNVILNNKYPVNIISLIGLLLVICAAILAMYTIKK